MHGILKKHPRTNKNTLVHQNYMEQYERARNVSSLLSNEKLMEIATR